MKDKFASEFESTVDNGKTRQVTLEIGRKKVDCEVDSTIDVANLTYVAGTNGLHGGDAGHGSRAVLTLIGTDGFCMGAKYGPSGDTMPFEKLFKDAEDLDLNGFESDPVLSVVVEGDAEIQAFADVLIKAGQALNRQIEQYRNGNGR